MALRGPCVEARDLEKVATWSRRDFTITKGSSHRLKGGGPATGLPPGKFSQTPGTDDRRSSLPSPLVLKPPPQATSCLVLELSEGHLRFIFKC